MCNAGYFDWLATVVIVILIGAAVWMLVRAWRAFEELQDLRDEAIELRDEARLLRNVWKAATDARMRIK
jgi:hypothetical protein